jgi:hypothetical protein
MRGEYSNKELASQLFYVLLFETSTNIQLFTKPGIGIIVDGAASASGLRIPVPVPGWVALF